MLVFFRPAVLLMNSLRYTSKLALTALLFLLPLLGAGYFIVQSNLSTQKLIQEEMRGIAFSRPAFSLLVLLQEHRWQFALSLTSTQTNIKKIEELRNRIDELIGELNQLHKNYPQIMTQDLWQTIQNQWLFLKKQHASLKTYAQHTELIHEVTGLIANISRNSNLTLDPEVGSYFLMSALEFRLPLMMESLWQPKISGAYWLSDSEIDITEQEDMAVKRERIREVLLHFKSDMDEVINLNHANKIILTNIKKPIADDTDLLLLFMEEEFVERNEIPETVNLEYQHLTTNLLRKINLSAVELANNLSDVLLQRLEAIQGRLSKQLLWVVIAVIIAIYFFIGMYLSSYNALQVALNASNQISLGNFTTEFKSETRDEYGVLLEKMLGTLQHSHVSLISELPIGVFVTDANGLCTYTNYAWQKIYGLSLAESLGEGWSKALHPDDIDAVFSEWRLTARQQQKFAMEFRILRKNGEIRYVNARAITIHNNQFIESGFIGSVEDVTDRKIMVEQLQDVVVQANAATKAKSEFLANMSHEIRTPMNAIIGLARLCLGTELSQKQRDYLEKIFYSGQSLLEIINDILDFSKIEAGKLSIESIPFYLQEVLTRMQSMMEPKAQEKNLTLTINAENIPRRLVGDPLRINQILLNLVSNAIKFTSKGSIRINVILLAETDDSLRLQFSILDTGIGMTADQTAKLFQSFVQADNSITRQYGGTGLGLAICKKLVELMNGNIHVQSQPGQGSTFCFDVLLGRAPADTNTQHNEAYKITTLKELSGVHVLLVEDNTINQQVAQEMLQQAGMQVVIANNGLEAIEIVRKKIFDVILMDMQMPIMDGVTAAMAIGQMENYKQVPIIAMTANAMQSDREECFKAGMVDHIAKPIDPDQLFKSLLQWVNPEIKITSNNLNKSEPGIMQPIVVQVNGELPDKIPNIDVEGVLKRLGGNRPFAYKLLKSFAQQNANTPSNIMTATESRDWVSLERISHTLKGTAGTIGLMQVSSAAIAVNNSLKEKNYQNIELLAKAFSEALDKVITGLKILI